MIASAQDDVAGTCAFLATYLAGRPTASLLDRRGQHGFGAVRLSSRHSCVWDEWRASFLHLQGERDGWQAYDVVSGVWLRIARTGMDYTFTDDSRPAWFERVSIAESEAHLSDSGGEHGFRLGDR